MDMKVRAITNQHIQREIGAMSRQGKAPKYTANAVGLLRPVLAMVSPDFVLDVNTPQKRKPNLRMLSEEEITLLMSAAVGNPAELPIMMALWMGMRISEIRGAKYKDISYRNGASYLHICRAIVDDENGKGVAKGAKSYAGDRTIRIPEYIMRLIGDGNPDDHIVSLTGQAIYKRYSRLLEKAGIPHCRFHDLRRANAAAMLMLDVDSKYAQERNGWASDYMYKQVYGYVMQGKMDAVSSAIDSYFGHKLPTEN
jgi:integrase